jgi:3-oxoacyl-[acyl-carrier protein] reductase
MNRQEGQHYIVTGGGTGIGKAIALRLASEGAKVSLMARNTERLQSVVDEIRQVGGEAQFFGCDITDQHAVQQSVSKAVATFGQLRGVVANSGVGGANFPGENDRFDIVVQTNVYGTYYTLRAAQEHLVSDGKPTHMVVTSSCLARFGVPGYTAYCASKAALLGMVRAFALELAGQGTQVNALCPGWVDTDMAWEGLDGMAQGMGITSEEAHDIAMKSVPLGRMSKPKEIAGTVAWLLSEDGAGVTGQGIDINAGSWMG